VGELSHSLPSPSLPFPPLPRSGPGIPATGPGGYIFGYLSLLEAAVSARSAGTFRKIVDSRSGVLRLNLSTVCSPICSLHDLLYHFHERINDDDDDDDDLGEARGIQIFEWRVSGLPSPVEPRR